MPQPFYKSPRLFSALFILSVPLSYFSIWAGAIITLGGVETWIGPFVVFRLLSYAIIMTVGMWVFRRIIFRKGTSVLKVALAAICAALVLFTVMALWDSAAFPILSERSFLSFLPERVSIYLTRFYLIGVIASGISGLLYHMSVQANPPHDLASTFT